MYEMYPHLKPNSRYKSVFKFTIKQSSVSKDPNRKREAHWQEETEGRKLSFINTHILLNDFFGSLLLIQSSTELSAQ